VVQLQGRYASDRPRSFAAVNFTMMQPLAALDVKIDTTHRPGQMEHVFSDETGVETNVGAAAFATYKLADLREVQLVIDAPDRTVRTRFTLDQIPGAIGISNHTRVVAET